MRDLVIIPVEIPEMGVCLVTGVGGLDNRERETAVFCFGSPRDFISLKRRPLPNLA